jgi:hypothetical protein
MGEVVDHDMRDIDAARKIAGNIDRDPMGLIYYNPDIPTYNDVRQSKVITKPMSEKVQDLNAELKKFLV